MNTIKRSFFSIILGSFCFGTLMMCCQADQKTGASSTTQHQPIVEELIILLDDNPDIEDALEASLLEANRLNVQTLPEYHAFMDEMVTLIPTTRNLLPNCLEIYYLIDNSPDDFLLKNELFSDWIHKFINDWGNFLDTPESAAGLTTFYTDPVYNISDYYVGPSGWLTFNEFFARSLKPGKRTIAGLCDDKIIVSAADNRFQCSNYIDKDAEITVKGVTYSVIELLDGSPYQDRFAGGIFMHSYLSAHDYHRFHVPVRGTVKESRVITEKVALDVVMKSDGSLDMVDGTGYQFAQERGLIVMESPFGLVAILPIGMGEVSSVTMTAEVGAELRKGEEFGFFQFGGSDMVILYEAGKVKITAELDTHYKVGEAIARVVK